MDDMIVRAEKFRWKLRDYLDNLIANKDAYFIITRNRREAGVMISVDRWQRLQILEAWAEAHKGKEDYEAGKTDLVTWEELQRLAEAKYGVDA
jgi:PHD/YefM family antitoxin component YafN of YafNO toxin-antitoxin module